MIKWHLPIRNYILFKSVSLSPLHMCIEVSVKIVVGKAVAGGGG